MGLEDPWLPKESGFRPLGVEESGRNMRVCDLIDGRSMQWKDSTLSSILQPEDAALVRSIPLPAQDLEDRLIWHYSMTGEYSVRSAYESALMMKRNGVGNSRGRGESSSRDAEKKIWTKVWNLPTPNKIKNFIWRCVQGALAIRENLFKRRVTLDMICPLCNNDCETFKHLFLECQFAQIMWRVSPIALVPTMNEQASILAWFDNVMDRWKGTVEEANNLTLCTMILWRIWRCRNKKLFNDNKIEPSQAILLAVKDATEYVAAMREEGRVQRLRPEPGESVPCLWQPPTAGKMKINVDGAWHSNSCKVGAGMVVRGTNGAFLAARAENLGHARSALMAEALVWRAALGFAEALGLETVVLEGDSQALVRILDSAAACPADIEVIVEDIRRGKHRFKECDFQFARRTANTVADKLASNGLQCVGTRTWEFRPPDWLQEFLDCDLY